MESAAEPAKYGTIESRPEYHIETLDVRAAIEGEVLVEQAITALLELRAGLGVLDVGTGAGTDALQVAELVTPGGHVVGIDHSPEMIGEARRRAGGSEVSVEFRLGEAHALDFADASFDRCRCDRVLSHVADPQTAIRELARVVRPGGLVVASDLDAGTVFVNSSDRPLATRLAVRLAGGLANGWVGRRLRRYLVAAGLEDVRCAPIVVQNHVAFMRMVFANPLQQMVDAGETTVEHVTEFWAELEEGERDGWLCSGVVCFTVVGRKPA
ncbi:MAG TPA: methyltransferase domain-containing protein [Jatrophihabitantaceae bacterium]|jgi:ubiquinone/menaquinone biosynthesis C-methylase UbiE